MPTCEGRSAQRRAPELSNAAIQVYVVFARAASLVSHQQALCNLEVLFDSQFYKNERHSLGKKGEVRDIIARETGKQQTTGGEDLGEAPPSNGT